MAGRCRESSVILNHGGTEWKIRYVVLLAQSAEEL